MKYITSSNVKRKPKTISSGIAGSSSLTVSGTEFATGYFVPANGVILWGGSSAPTGYSFETALDGYFVMGASTVDLAARGASTHTHTNPGTNNTGSHNNHTATVGTSSSPDDNNYTGKLSAGTTYVNASHVHGIGSTANESWAGNHSHTIGSTDSASSMPMYKKLKWIKTTSYREVPIGGIVMHKSSSTSLGAKWHVCDGTSGTPDMRGYFVYGGTGSGGGASSHSHTNPNTSNTGAHTHTVDITSANNESWYLVNDSESAASTGVQSITTHKHTATATSNSGGAHAHTVNNTSSNTVLPPYIQLYFIQRIS